jgi:hypothetical protein
MCENLCFGDFQLIMLKVKVRVTLRPTLCRPVRLGIRHTPGTRDQFSQFSLIFFDSFGCVDVGRPLWREVGAVLFSF